MVVSSTNLCISSCVVICTCIAFGSGQYLHICSVRMPEKIFVYIWFYLTCDITDYNSCFILCQVNRLVSCAQPHIKCLLLLYHCIIWYADVHIYLTGSRHGYDEPMLLQCVTVKWYCEPMLLQCVTVKWYDEPMLLQCETVKTSPWQMETQIYIFNTEKKTQLSYQSDVSQGHTLQCQGPFHCRQSLWRCIQTLQWRWWHWGSSGKGQSGSHSAHLVVWPPLLWWLL